MGEDIRTQFQKCFEDFLVRFYNTCLKELDNIWFNDLFFFVRLRIEFLLVQQGQNIVEFFSNLRNFASEELPDLLQTVADVEIIKREQWPQELESWHSWHRNII